MACAIVATPKGSTSNSYATISESDTYHDNHLYSEVWDDADADQKCRALVMATRLLDTWFDWYGAVTTLTQKLLWPRSGVIRPGISEGGDVGSGVTNPWGEPFAVLLDAHVIPDRIREATAELARQLLTADRTEDSDLETDNIRALRVGPIALDFGTVVAKPIPDSVLSMVSSLGRQRSRSGSGAVHMFRG